LCFGASSRSSAGTSAAGTGSPPSTIARSASRSRTSSSAWCWLVATGLRFADLPDREVERGPLPTRPRRDRHPVPSSHTECHQPSGGALDLVEEHGAGHIARSTR
jgi:hypothetical protein